MANSYSNRPTTIRGYHRIKGTTDATPAPLKASLVASFDPTSVSQIALGTLPAGAIPLGIDSLGGATGGTNPTVDVGTAGDDDGFANELDADGIAFNDTGALTGIELTVDTVVYGKVGASAATGGTTTVVINYVMNDDGGAR